MAKFIIPPRTHGTLLFNSKSQKHEREGHGEEEREGRKGRMGERERGRGKRTREKGEREKGKGDEGEEKRRQAKPFQKLLV